MLSISVMRWALFATSLSHAVRRSSVTGQRRVTISKRPKVWQMTITSLASAIDEDRQPELTAERVEKWVKQVREELNLGRYP